MNASLPLVLRAALVGVAAVLAFSAQPVGAAALATASAQALAGDRVYVADGRVEAVRESRVAAQVPGRITELAVQAGDRVTAGQVLLRIDPSVAAEQVAASRAQLAQAQALVVSARADYERARRLHAKQYLSQAGLDRAEAQFKAAQAQARALSAQAAATRSQAGYYEVRAPYAGWVAQLEIAVGDMAAPGRTLLTVYDPSSLRVSVAVPESMLERLDRSAPATAELPSAPAGARMPGGLKTVVLPALDLATHSATVRADLPSDATRTAGAVPGQFARLHLPLTAAGTRTDPAPPARVGIPAQAVVRRGELTAVYVVAAAGQPRLRQVRLGPLRGEQVEVLAGLRAGEQVALDPVAAARLAAGAAGTDLPAR